MLSREFAAHLSGPDWGGGDFTKTLSQRNIYFVKPMGKLGFMLSKRKTVTSKHVTG